MPTCQAYKCPIPQEEWQGKCFFKITEPKNATEDCIKRNLMYKHFNMQPGRKELVERAVPIIFADQTFDQINMDETKELLPRHVSENRRKRDTEKDVIFVSQ